MRLFKSLRKYRDITIVEMVYANNEFEVHEYLDWEKEDVPKLQIEEVPYEPGCFMSVMVRNYA